MLSVLHRPTTSNKGVNSYDKFGNDATIWYQLQVIAMAAMTISALRLTSAPPQIATHTVVFKNNIF